MGLWLTYTKQDTHTSPLNVVTVMIFKLGLHVGDLADTLFQSDQMT
jgi:hypothetical protein